MHKPQPPNGIGPQLSLSLSKHSLGPFVLGSTLFSTLDYLRTVAGRQSYPWVHIKYDTKAVSTGPIIVTLLPSLHLVFSSHQTLSQIHLLDLPLPTLSLTYHPTSVQPDSITLCTPLKPLTFGTTSSVFGPTFNGTGAGRQPVVSGETHAEGDVKEVWYPGLGFRGKERGGEIGLETRSWREENVGSIHLCEREEWRDSLGADPEEGQGWKALKRKVKVDQNGLDKVVVDPTTRSTALCFLRADQEPLTIRLNQTTSTDLLVELGPPLRTFWKDDSRLRIHWLGDSDESEDEDGLDEQGSYFWNYLQHGIDFLLSPSHKVIKIILHSNLPGSVTFGRFERCPWEFRHGDLSLNVTQKTDALLDQLSSESHRARNEAGTEGGFFGKENLERGMELDRSGEGWGQGVLLGASTLVAASPNLVFEVLESGFVESVIMF